MTGGNMSSFIMDVGKLWLEWRGRRRPVPRYIFQENEIVSPPYRKSTSHLWQAMYLNLHPTHFAVAIGPTGKMYNLQGGYNVLPPGRYNVHYIDRQSRVTRLPRIEEKTYDGAKVALELVITYRVVDPIKALEIQQPVETLLDFIQSDLKEFIRSHKYDEIIGDLKGHKLQNEELVQYIRGHHMARSPICKLFYIMDVVIKERIGDPKIIEQREKLQINQRQFDTQSELQRQNQELERRVTEQDAVIRRMKVEAEGNLQESTRKIEMQKIELERARQEFQYRQDKWMKAMGAIDLALSSPAHSRDPQVLQGIQQLLGTMGVSPASAAEAGARQKGRLGQEEPQTPNPEDMDSLTNNLLSLLARKKF